MSVLSRAEELVSRDRLADYGDPREMFDGVARVWSAILGCPVTASQAALCMAGLKLVREAHRHKPDNLVDLAGYARVLELIHDGAPHAHRANVGVSTAEGVAST